MLFLGELGEFGGGGAELFGGGADVSRMHGGGFVADEFHGEALGDAGGLEHGGDGGAQGVEGFTVPCASGAGEVFALEADVVEADELGEFRGGVGVAAEGGVDVDGGFASGFLGGGVAGERPRVEVRLHGLVEFAGGFAGDDVDGAVLPVEGFPAEGEDVAEALAVGADAAADGGGPFVGEFGEEEADFVEGEGFVDYFFVASVRGDFETVAWVFGYDFRVECIGEGGADGGECFADCFMADLVAARVNPRFDVGAGDEAAGFVCAAAEVGEALTSSVRNTLGR